MRARDNTIPLRARHDDELSGLLLSLYAFAGDAAAGPDFLATLDATRTSQQGIADELPMLNSIAPRPPDGIACPLVVLHGAHDRLTDRVALQTHIGTFEHLDLRILPDAGHLVMVTHWQTVVDLLAELRDAHARGGRRRAPG